MKNTRPGFCIECKAPLDPEDESRECWRCYDESSPPWDDDWSYFYWEMWIESARNEKPAA